MHRYSRYKETDIPWLSEIPQLWNIIRGKYLYNKEKREVRDDDEIVTCFRDGTVTLRKNRRTEGFTESIKEIGYQGVRCGDLVIHVMDAFAGSIGVSNSDGKATPVYSVCSSKHEGNNWYYAYLLRTMARSGFIQSLYRGIRERSSDFRFDVFAAQYYPVPPRNEQDQIVRYLDWKTSEINKLIHRYQDEIGLLREKEQSSICELVLHGSEDHEYCDSGDRFLGKMPTGWQCLRNKYIFRERSEYSETGKEVLLSVSKHYGVKKYSELKEEEQYATIKPAETLVGYKVVKKNDLVMNIMRARNGSYGISNYDGIVSPAYAVYKPVRECNPVYLHYFMKTPQVVSMFEAYSYGIAEHRRRLYPQDFLRLFSFVPPLSEQNEIAGQATEIHEKYESLCRKIEREIELLREYRTRLISDVVTGQMDVRNVEIPDYIPEQDSVTDTLDEASAGEVDADAE